MRRLALILWMSWSAIAAESFHYSVVRARPLWPDEPGQLQIDGSGVSYQSENGKTKFQLAFEDIREADVSGPQQVRIETYDRLRRKAGGRREYTFRLREAKHGEDLARFLSQRLARPVLGDYAVAAPAAFSIPAYHRHALRGVAGKLEIGPEAVRFVAAKPEDSRTWLYRDIESIGNSDPLHLRVSTYAETYMFDLKERLPREAYEYAWQRVWQPAWH
jgi:hypothetical protein